MIPLEPIKQLRKELVGLPFPYAFELLVLV